MPHNNNKPELIELLINEEINNQQVNNPVHYVEVINRARPQGFAEHFALLLEDTPTIHSSGEPAFFSHFFLGSILTLPNTELMSKLNIEDILFKIDEHYKNVKLVFKIRNQNHLKLKFIIINSGTEQNIGFTNEELSEIKNQLSYSKGSTGNIISHELEGQILYIVKNKGFKLKILPELSHQAFIPSTLPQLSSNIQSTFHKVRKDITQEIEIDNNKKRILQDFDPLLAQLSSNDISSVHQNTEDTFVLLKKIYKSYPPEVLGHSEASYHGYSYGFFRLNYKYKYALDCYVERIAGKGYMDLVLLSRNNDKGDNNQQIDNVANHKHQNSPPKDKKQFIPIIVELKAGTGALKAIEQIHESGYIYNLPNIRTNAKEAVIVGVDFSTAFDQLKVENLDIKKTPLNLISQLAKDVFLKQEIAQKITQGIHKTIEHLYYASIKSKDHHYLSRVLLGQAFTSQDKINKQVFLYNKEGKLNLISDRVTTIVLHQDSKGIILNIIEGSNTPHTRFKSKKQDKIFDDSKILPIENLDIQYLTIINIAVNPKAEIFSGLTGKNYITLQDIKIEKKSINEFRYHQKYQGQFQSIATVKAQYLIDLICNTDSSIDSDNYVPPNKKKKVLDKDLQKVLLECLSPVKEFINQESDLQAIIQGMFINQKLLGGKQIKVFSEVSCGPGRVDLALSIVDKAFQEDKPILIELKYGSNNMLLTDAEKQLTAYSQYLKSATTYKEVQHIAMVYNPNSKQNNFLQVKISSKKIDHTSQSSDNAQDSSTINSVNKQVKKVLEISELEFLKSIKTIDDDIFLDLSYDTNRQKLSNEKFEAVIEFLNKVTVSSSSTITLSLASNHINQDHATKLFQLLEQNVSINSLDLSNTNLNQELLKGLIETLKKKENLIISEPLSSADKLYILKKFLEELSIDISIAQVQHQKARQLLDEIQAVERLDIDSEERNKQLENIFIRQKNMIRFSSLQRLYLSNNQLGQEAAPILQDALETLDGLEEINLSNNKIGDAGLKSIAQGLENNYSIKILKLSNIGITKIKELSKILSKKMAIMELDLSGNKLSNAEIAVLLDDLTKANAIKKLNLADNDIQGKALESLAEFITTSNSLQELNLSETNLGNEGLALITPALSNSNLKLFLDISHNKISNADILFKSLNPDYQDSALTGLVLAHNEISEVIALSDALIENKKLLYLDLSNNQIIFEKAAYIFFSLHPVDEDGTARNDILSTLILSNNPIRIDLQDQDNIQDLQMMLSHNDGLTHLALSNIAIDDSVLTKILDSLQENTRLESIDLSYNQIQLINVEAQKQIREFLRENTILAELNLANNQITDQGGKIIISSFLEKEIMNKKITKRTEFIDLNLSGNPSLGNEFINQLINIIKDEYPIENLRLANNNWSKGHTTKLIDAIVASKERKVNIDLSGNEISKNSQIKFNNYRAAINLQILDDDLQNSIIATCLPGTSRSKRSINECKIGWLDVDEMSSIKTRKSTDIIIDSQKFLKYSKQYIKDEQKSLQLVRLAEEIKNKGNKKIVGDNQGLFDRVIKAGGYQNYIQQERINDLGSYIINRDSDSISLELKLKLINAVGKVQLMHGLHSTIVSCQDGSASGCALSVSGLGYSFLSQPIEDMMVKVVPKITENTISITSKLAPKALSYDTKFILQTLGVKYGTKIAKGGAGAIASIFDIVDIGMASNILIECNKRNDSNSCSDKEIRDNIASITFSSVSFISGIGLAAVGAGPAAVGVGAIIMLGQGIYSGISNVIEYQKYNTTFSENMEIFFRSLLFMSPPRSVEHLAARTKYVNDTVLSAWEELNNLPDNIVAYAIGLGEVEFRNIQKSRKTILSSPVFCPTGLKNCSPDIIYYQDTVYSPSRITVPTFIPSYAMINMSREESASHVRGQFSRVLPNPIKGSNMICLPKVSEQAYELYKQNNSAVSYILMCLNIPLCIISQISKSQEYQQSQSTDEYIQMSRYNCNNAVVLEHVSRMNLDFKNKSIVYNLQNVNAGKIFGSKKLNNIFLVFEGDMQIFGGTDSNEFIMFRDKYNGSIYLDKSTNNIIDVSKLSSDVISMQYYNKDMIITTDKARFRINKTENAKIEYIIGRKNKIDKIICKQLLYRDYKTVNNNEVEHNNIIIDSAGGANYSSYGQDQIQNCSKVIVSPNTVVQGSNGNYTIYIKSLDYATHYKSNYATSEIDIAGNVTIVFPEIALLKDCIEIKRLPTNGLSIIMPLGHNAQYELILSNYLNKDNYTNYVLIDKYGSHIVPRLDRIKKDNLVKDFEMHSSVKFDTVIEVVAHYRNISYSREDYAVFSTINNMQLYNMIFKFGSSERDIIILDKDVLYIEGNNGSDLYIINDNIDYPVRINNKAQDLQLDILKLPINDIFNISLIANDNHLHLLFNNKDEVKGYRDMPQEVIIDNYFQDNLYKHIALMDKNNNNYIPFKQSEVIELLPFYHASFDRNIFILSSNNKEAVIDIDVDNIVLHKQGNNLLLTEKEAGSFNRLNIILRDYYKNQKQWLDTKLYSYSNGGISNIIDLNNIQRSAISYQEQYDNVIKEYVVDLTNGASYFITYNHHNSLRHYYNVDAQDERVGVVIFKNTPLKRLIVTDHQDHIFQDKLYSNYTLIIRHWQKSKYHISMFEFHNGLNQERIPVLNTTISRILLNNELDKHLNNIDIKVVKAVIYFLKLSYAKYNKQCNVSQELRYNFLEEELSYRIGDSYNQNYSSEEIRKYLSSSNDTTENRYIVGKVFMLLALKSYNELLIKYPYISNKDLHKIGDSYFYTVLPNSEVMIKTLNDNTHATISVTTKHTNDLDNIYQYIINNQQEIQQIITKLADSDNYHKHRHHHGAICNREKHNTDNKTISGDHRVRRDIEEELQIHKDTNDNNDDITVSVGNVAVMSSSSSGSSVKPIGYNVINWVKEQIGKMQELTLSNCIESIHRWYKGDEINIQTPIIAMKDSDIILGNVSNLDNLIMETNILSTLNTVSLNHVPLLSNGSTTDLVSTNSAFNINGTLMLANLVVRMMNPVQDKTTYNIINDNTFNNQVVDLEYAQRLAYNGYTPNIDNGSEDTELVVCNDRYYCLGVTVFFAGNTIDI